MSRTRLLRHSALTACAVFAVAVPARAQPGSNAARDLYRRISASAQRQAFSMLWTQAAGQWQLRHVRLSSAPARSARP